MPSSIQHRAHTSHPTIENRTQLRWRDGHVVRESSARLLKISRGMAFLRAETRPPLFQLVEIRLHEPQKTEWVEGFVARRGKAGEIALVLQQVTPVDFYAIAITGQGYPGRRLWRPLREARQA